MNSTDRLFRLLAGITALARTEGDRDAHDALTSLQKGISAANDILAALPGLAVVAERSRSQRVRAALAFLMPAVLSELGGRHEVHLVRPGNSRAQAITLVHVVTRWNLHYSTEAVNNLPAEIVAFDLRSDAEDLAKRFEEIGCTVTIRADLPPLTV
jgi:ribosomal protein L7/L12